ncbi:N-acetyltransferase [Paenibacillus marchantiophytorum]|uniref:N-acetyltransferase n=1 Tax=Paenibacillus marchantiophytorum TaxID=1619310 RepID=A0ABQ2BQT7_9BACL|nr:GNAT family N-acetyltransferase [Paenibacillus marchantiophytorum]GGI45445.1 N-acetyltransferase [Paenibacillus marchantiophytorum]
MRIRPVVTDSDLNQSYEIERSVYTKEAAASPEAFLLRKEAFGAYFLVAEMTGIETVPTIIGVTNGIKLNHIDLADESIKQGIQSAANGSYWCILTIAVHPLHQRQGVATALLQHIIRIAQSDHLKGIVLMCEEHLIPFYEKHGFHYMAPSKSEHGGIQWHEMHLIWN